MITDDDADDADFMPHDAISDEDDGDDISGVDGELAKVTRHEIHDLMDGCWQTIAGPKDSSTSSFNKSKEVKSSMDMNDDMERTTDSTDICTESDRVETCHSHDAALAESRSQNGLNEDTDKSHQTQSGMIAPSSSSCSSSDTVKSGHHSTHAMQKGRIHEKGPGGVVVSHLLSESRYTDLCLDEIPVCVIRNLLTRQMSMAIQLLLQMLLISDIDSECFDR